MRSCICLNSVVFALRLGTAISNFAAPSMRMHRNTLLKACVTHGNRRGANHLYNSVTSHKNGWIAVPLNGTILKNESFKISGNDQRKMLTSRPTHNSHVFEMTCNPFIFIRPDHSRLTQALHRAIFVKDLPQGTITAPLMTSIVFYTDQFAAI